MAEEEGFTSQLIHVGACWLVLVCALFSTHVFDLNFDQCLCAEEWGISLYVTRTESAEGFAPTIFLFSFRLMVEGFDSFTEVFVLFRTRVMAVRNRQKVMVA